MNKPFKVSSTTAEVSVTAILSGSPPAIKVMYRAENARGTARQFARQIPVPDADLFRRLQANIKQGERIQVTTVSEWYEDGYTSYLSDFTKVEDVADNELKAIRGNETYVTEQSNKSKILEVSR